ncbi:MAG: DUF2948 domain-containing protein [Rhodovulum sulfidophilum]|uniref:DUF2948 domain-containing protein n=1 Tax=Rhodovulum sulfidophilum TaxID=35806 RepID=A0A2W5N8E8_RHOSU|nr:MAG: DUF2948 domain-containing protein [Rhodovulum sulfidophilum]
MSEEAEDARFEDGVETALRLRAETAEDLAVISALAQDAVGQTSDIAWMPRRRRFTLLVNRFRWEDARAAARQGRPVERTRALLTIDGVLSAKANGIDPKDRDLVLSLLAIGFEPREDGAGTLRLTLAGDGEIALAVECLDVSLRDVTRPYAAPSGKAPRHPED